ncbi:uncharacterized protein LOC105178254 [Sesamum indicum]|uniref:Uncharacterized protein LOC105178254 n=1 Tax=Sesamum indicum TaxID=4182 RepID=A0A6I9UI77_SESIN|nr:uncharacterized protein LOC105178254 [Sesamum indicum]
MKSQGVFIFLALVLLACSTFAEEAKHETSDDELKGTMQGGQCRYRYCCGVMGPKGCTRYCCRADDELKGTMQGGQCRYRYCCGVMGPKGCTRYCCRAGSQVEPTHDIDSSGAAGGAGGADGGTESQAETKN